MMVWKVEKKSLIPLISLVEVWNYSMLYLKAYLTKKLVTSYWGLFGLISEKF